RESALRTTFAFPPSTSSESASCRRKRSEPFGPLTENAPFSAAIFTPPGTTTGVFPSRDMGMSLCDFLEFERLEDRRQQLAADAELARLASTHDAARRREDRGALAATDLRDLARRDVTPAARLAHPRDAADHALAVAVVAQHDAQRAGERLGK